MNTPLPNWADRTALPSVDTAVAPVTARKGRGTSNSLRNTLRDEPVINLVPRIVATSNDGTFFYQPAKLDQLLRDNSDG